LRPISKHGHAAGLETEHISGIEWRCGAIDDFHAAALSPALESGQ
jgi:hypothetical protein